MVTPPALMAATPVGATTIIRFDERSLTVLRNVVLPVPAFPVRKMLVPVCSTNSHAVASSLLCSMFLVCTMLGRRGSGVVARAVCLMQRYVFFAKVSGFAPPLPVLYIVLLLSCRCVCSAFTPLYLSFGGRDTCCSTAVTPIV